MLAVISDVHSNLHALRAVLDAIDDEVGLPQGATGIDEVVCLGDVVGYAAHPSECLALVRERCDLVLLGNHDHAVAASDAYQFNPHANAGVRHSREQLDRGQLEYLKGLEPMVRKRETCFVHASPREPIREYVFPDTSPDDLQAIAEAAGTPYLVMGHTHVPMDLEVDGVRLLNPGSVGQPRDGDPRASYALYAPAEGRFEHVRVEYDVEGAVKAVLEAGLPEFNGERLQAGM